MLYAQIKVVLVKRRTEKETKTKRRQKKQRKRYKTR